MDENSILSENNIKPHREFESTHDGFFSLDFEWRFSYVYRKTTSKQDREPKELIGSVFWETYPNILGTALETACKDAMDKRLIQCVVMQDVRRTGIWYTITVCPSNGGISVYWQDTTEQKTSKEKIINSEKRFRALVMANSDLLSVLNLDWSKCSQLNERLGLLPLSEIVSLDHSCIPNEDNVLIDVALAEGIKKKRPIEIEHRIWRTDGSLGWIFTRAVPIMDMQGEISEWISQTKDITEHKQMELKLHYNEEMLRMVLDKMIDGIHLADYKTRKFIYTNPALAALTGYSIDELNHFTIEDLEERMHDENRKESEEQLKQLFSGYHGMYDTSLRWQIKNGEYRWLNVRRKLIFDSQGEPTFLIQIVRDITKQKKVEEELEERLNELKAIFQAAPDGLIVYNIDGVPVYYNEAARILLGIYPVQIDISLADHIKKTNPCTLDGERLTIESSPTFLSLKEGKVIKDFVIFSKGSHLIYHSLSSAPIRNNNGEIVGAVLSLKDITDQKLAEEALRASEEYFRSLFDTMDEGFSLNELIRDPQGKVVDYRVHAVNNAFEKNTGIAPNKVLGRLRSELNPIHDEYLLEACARTVETGESIRFDYYNIGFNRWFNIGLFPCGGDTFAQLFNDISESKRAEESLRESENKAQLLIQQLKQYDVNKNEFLNILSHELRNPLASIMMSLSLLNKKHFDEDSQKAFEIMSRQTSQLSHLVDDLLDVTRISQNKISLKKQRISLAKTVYGAVLDYMSYFELKGVTLETVLTNNHLLIEADPSRITQVIGNLLHNSLKFTSKGDYTKVSLWKDDTTREAVIDVIDNGLGIDPELLPDLFLPFTQVDRTLDRSQGGLGLGLSIVKGIIELHHGSISVVSEGMGKGTKFTIRLPLPFEKGITKDDKVPVSNASSRHFKILVIDDIPDVAEILCSLLRFLGHDVISALDGIDGIEKAKDFLPDIILSDIGLPNMNGYEVAKCIRSDDTLKNVFLIALSGYAQQEDIDKAKEAGFDRHIAKPVDLEALELILASIP